MITKTGVPSGVRAGSELVAMLRLLEQYDYLVQALLARPSLPVGADTEEGFDLTEALRAFEVDTLQRYLSATNWNVKRTAVLLRMPRQNLIHRLKKYGLKRES